MAHSLWAYRRFELFSRHQIRLIRRRLLSSLPRLRHFEWLGMHRRLRQRLPQIRPGKAPRLRRHLLRPFDYASASLRTGSSPRWDARSSSGLRYWPVKLFGLAATFSGTPSATISPPFSPPPGTNSGDTILNSSDYGDSALKGPASNCDDGKRYH